MKKIRLWLSCLFMFMLLMHIDAQAQELVHHRQVLTAQQNDNAPAFANDSDHYQAVSHGTNQLAQAKSRTYQKRTIKFESISENRQEARRSKQKYKNGQFKRPKKNPRNRQ